MALRTGGEGSTVTGSFRKEHDTAYTLFFNSPYQEISWNIAPNWTGYYILFSEAFMEQHLPHLSLLKDFPFFRIDQTVPMSLMADEARRMLHAFEAIYSEYYSNNGDAFRIIAPHTRLLLEHTRRCFEKHATGPLTENNGTADIVLVSRVKVLLETAFSSSETFSKPHAAATVACEANNNTHFHMQTRLCALRRS